MKLGKFKIFITIFIFIFFRALPIFAEDKIESVPLINLEELSPTFEEDKDELEEVEKLFANKKTRKKIKFLKFPSFIFFHIFFQIRK